MLELLNVFLSSVTSAFATSWKYLITSIINVLSIYMFIWINIFNLFVYLMWMVLQMVSMMVRQDKIIMSADFIMEQTINYKNIEPNTGIMITIFIHALVFMIIWTKRRNY